MSKAKFLPILLLLFILLASGTLEGHQFLLKIPGIDGGIQQPGFEGCMPIVILTYSFPGVPLPNALLSNPPAPDSVVISATEIDNPIIELKKELDEASQDLYDLFKNKRIIPSLKVAILNDAGNIVAAIHLDNVLFTKIKRDKKMETLFLKFKNLKCGWGDKAKIPW